MELLLIDDVKGLGGRGEIVSVARGYARNYLIPKGLARTPTDDLVKAVRAKAVKHAAEQEVVKANKMAVAKELATVSLKIPMKASAEGSLYGSVSQRQIADLLVERGFAIEEKNVVLDQHLKEVGEFDVSISLHAEVVVPVKVEVVADEG